MHTTECVQWNAHNSIRPTKSAQWSLYGIYTMEPVPWNPHEGQAKKIRIRTIECCNALDGMRSMETMEGA